MKTKKQVDDARETLRRRIIDESEHLSREQLALLSGMLNALVWVADAPNSSTIERVLSGEPFPKARFQLPNDN